MTKTPDKIAVRSNPSFILIKPGAQYPTTGLKETKRTRFLITASSESAYFVVLSGQSEFLLQSNIQIYHEKRHFAQNGTQMYSTGKIKVQI